jgi:hypothetical protein
MNNMNSDPINRLMNIKQRLKLTSEPWLNIPDDLLLMAFRPSSVPISLSLRKELKSKYGMVNLEDLEFLGDAVIEFIATQIVFDHSNGGPGFMTNRRIVFIKNTSLFCIMKTLNLCELNEHTGNYKIKDCADIFEALIGALYYYLYYLQKRTDYMMLLEQYVKSNFYTQDIINNVVNNHQELDTCKVNETQTAGIVGKDYIIVKKFVKDQQKIVVENAQLLCKRIQILSKSTKEKIKLLTKEKLTSFHRVYLQDPQLSTMILSQLYTLLNFKNYEFTVFTPETNSEGKYGVTISEIDFDKLTYKACNIGIGITKEEAVLEVSKKVLQNIFTHWNLTNGKDQISVMQENNMEENNIDDLLNEEPPPPEPVSEYTSMKIKEILKDQSLIQSFYEKFKNHTASPFSILESLYKYLKFEQYFLEVDELIIIDKLDITNLLRFGYYIESYNEEDRLQVIDQLSSNALEDFFEYFGLKNQYHFRNISTFN